MFEQSILVQGRTHKPWTVVVALVAELAMVALAIVIPLLFVTPLPMRAFSAVLIAPPPPPPPPPPPAPAVVRTQPKMQPRQFVAGKLFAPKTVPKHVALIKEAPAPPLAGDGVVGGVVGGVPGGQLGGVLGGIISSTAAPPPPPPVAAAPKPVAPPTPSRIRVGGQVEAARIVRQVLPQYPPLARMARVQGVVVLDAVIAKDGAIKQLKVVSGPPLLIQAAMSAVEQWAYKPTLLNGQPVEVETEVVVNFTLS